MTNSSGKSKASKATRSKLLDAVVAHLAGPESPIGEPQPLSAEQLAACEQAAGVALSPALYALLSFDAGWINREYDWFDGEMRLQARPVAEVIADHAGVFLDAYMPLLEARFAGKALALDQGSDSMRFLYLGDPDARGEYPVLYIDHDDTPMLGVEYASFDEWLAVELGLRDERDEDAAEKRCKKILGVPYWDDAEVEDMKFPAPTPAPPPGSIDRAPLRVVPKPRSAPKKLTDKQLDKALGEAAKDGNQTRLEELIVMAKERVRSKALDEALVFAARMGYPAAVTALLAAGASANAREYYGCALARAIGKPEELEIARALLAAGADPNGPSTNGETALHEAVKNGSQELVRMLLEAGADPNRGDDNGFTPLVTASRRSLSGKDPAPELVDVLIDHGANPNPSIHAPLRWAVEGRRPEVVARLIARGADLEHVFYGGRRALHLAYAAGNDDLVRQLIAAGADRSAADDAGISLEHIFGPGGEDVRPFDVHYVASETAQDIVIEARLAVLDAATIRTLHTDVSMASLARLAQAGHAAGAEFDPTSTRFEVSTDASIAGVTHEGFVDLRWVVRVAAVAPRFMRVLAAHVLDGTASHRGVSLSIRGELQGDGLDGETLRSWLADPYVQLGAFGETLPFELAIEPSGSPSVTIQARDGKPHVDVLFEALMAWREPARLWPMRGKHLVIPQMPAKNAPDHFALNVIDVTTGTGGHPLPFTSTAYVDALKNVLRVVHATIPLARVTLTGAVSP